MVATAGPGLPAPDAEGFGFGAEGDWKTAALLRTMKVMSYGLPGGTSFMEDYTYHFTRGNELVLGSHMLEDLPVDRDRPSRCSTCHTSASAEGRPRPPGLRSQAGPALNASLIDLGNRFRLIVNEVEAIKQPKALPKLPVARGVWNTNRKRTRRFT
jgi:L-arabinose isomerase